MARARGGFKTRRRHKKVLKATEGFRNSASRSFSKAYEAYTRALKYAFRDRKVKKQDFRGLWIQRIAAACKNEGTSYSKLIGALVKGDIGLDRKVLADIALRDPASFKAILDTVKSSLN
ncbi:MAG: 50S ribosomal protein L20 [Bdellovibrionota bacterium]